MSGTPIWCGGRPANDNALSSREATLLRLHGEPCVHYTEEVVHGAIMRAIRPFMDALERFYLAWAGDPWVVQQPEKQVHGRSGIRGDWRVMPCAIHCPASLANDFPGGIDAVKVIGTNEEERVVGDKISVGKALLLHPTDHHVEAIFDVAALSSFRTAAISVLAAKYCGYAGDCRAGIVGAGRLGYYTAAILREWLGCRRLLVNDCVEPRWRLFVETVAEWYGDAAEAADLATMCQQSQAVFLATTSSTPVVDVRLGGGIPFISSVGADADNLSELAPDLLPGRLLVSESAQNIALGDLRRWHAAGLIGPADIRLLADVMADATHGRAINQPVLFVSTGTAVQDALLCRFLHDLLQGRGGMPLGGRPHPGVTDA